MTKSDLPEEDTDYFLSTIFKQPWVLVLVIVSIFVAMWVVIFGLPKAEGSLPKTTYEPKIREHLDHGPFFQKAFANPHDVTRACLECHQDSARQMMKTAHWNWLGNKVTVPGHKDPVRIGKRNLINNFCIGIKGNWASCTRCHAGYGWKDEKFDFEDQSSVDCLVCHDRTGSYLKGNAGLPRKGVDLLAVAKGVGYPRRDNCGVCHHYGGGGLGVKHGDLDNTLDNPTVSDDVHMGRENMLCIDCHVTNDHDIAGRSMSVSVERSNGVSCTDCHDQSPHIDARLNAHTTAVACETCHIPTYARRVPTKMHWDWSKAGDSNRKEDIHEYLKIKGEFIYDNDTIPTYRWYNGSAHRYLLGDPMPPDGVTLINEPIGNINDPSAKIHPFKVHVALQPYDVDRKVLLQPVTSGDGGYWHDFDWDKALRLGSKVTQEAFSGNFGFAETKMYWPLSHMVTPKENALRCDDCHGERSRFDWSSLGYVGDPITTGGRR